MRLFRLSAHLLDQILLGLRHGGTPPSLQRRINDPWGHP